MKAVDWADRIPYRPRTRGQFVAALRRLLRRNGVPYKSAEYDRAGNCVTCGECGRCPGVHTLEEIQRKGTA